MKGIRTFVLTLIGLAIFTVILLLHPNINPLHLGLGIGLLISPKAVKDAVEYWAGRKQ